MIDDLLYCKIFILKEEYNMCDFCFSKIIFRLISLITVVFIAPSHAQITLDGSLGDAGPLTGPDYRIDAHLGRQAGNNLFHSFSEFNINTGETATFTGTEPIENVIGRVTGENYSFIDGVLKSTIPHANLYFFNPNGVIMGPDVKLEILGAFHLSSTDYLQFSDGQRFEANTKAAPLLSVASPEQFGFLEKIGEIGMINSQFEQGEKDFSVTAGHLQIIGSELRSITLDGIAGDILLQALGSIEIIGSQIVSETLPNAEGTTGNIILNSQTLLVSDELEIDEVVQKIDRSLIGTRTLGRGKGGDVQIKAAQFSLDNSAIFAETEGIGSGGDIVLEVDKLEINEKGGMSTTSHSAGNSGNINIQATEAVSIFGDAEQFNTFLTADTKGKGNGGNILILTPDLELDGGLIQAGSFDEGDAGNIHLAVEQLTLKNKAAILGSSRGVGEGGQIQITGVEINEVVDQMLISGGGIASSAENVGHGGTIDIAANVLTLDQEATIQTLTDGKGDAGDIRIAVKEMTIINGADIDASNEGKGYSKSGEIEIEATGQVLITGKPVTEEVLASNQGFVYNNHLGGIYSIAKKTGHGGNINLSAGQLFLQDNGVISAKSTAYAGDAGNIHIHTKALHIEMGEAWIDVSSEFGLNGEFILNSTKLRDPFLLLSPGEFQEIKLSVDPCAEATTENLSHFFTVIRGGVSTSPEDLAK
jgi:filamentous hemagglutinin family protein